MNLMCFSQVSHGAKHLEHVFGASFCTACVLVCIAATLQKLYSPLGSRVSWCLSSSGSLFGCSAWWLSCSWRTEVDRKQFSDGVEKICLVENRALLVCECVCVCALHLLPLCVQLVPSLQHLSLQRHPPLFLLLLLSPPRLFLLPLSPPLLHLGFDCSLEEETGGGITATILWYLKSIPPLLSSPPPPLTCCSSCLSLLLSLSSIWAGSSRAVMVLRWLDEKHKRTTQNIYWCTCGATSRHLIHWQHLTVWVAVAQW